VSSCAGGLRIRSTSATRVAERRSLRAEVADALRAAVIAGQMSPGRVYSVPMLAGEFGVSATPVREALRNR